MTIGMLEGTKGEYAVAKNIDECDTYCLPCGRMNNPALSLEPGHSVSESPFSGVHSENTHLHACASGDGHNVRDWLNGVLSNLINGRFAGSAHLCELLAAAPRS